MSSRKKNKSVNKVQDARSLRSKGPVVGAQDIFLADSATSGPYWTGMTPHPPAVDAPRGPEVTPMTENPVETTTRSPLKIKVRRPPKPRSPPPVVVEVDAFLTHPRVPLANARRKAPLQVPEGQGSIIDIEAEESEVEAYPTTSRKPLAPSTRRMYPSSPGWQRPYRKYIEERGEPLEKEFTGISETVVRSLDEAEKTRGGPNAILGKVTSVAHNAFLQQTKGILQDDSADWEGEAGRAEYSQDLLECIRRVMVIEARTRPRTFKIPPGGPLGVRDVPGESIPAKEGLRIDQYSNATYWQFAPYLEPEFRTALEDLYLPNDQAFYSIGIDDLKNIRTALERRVVDRRLVMRYDVPSLRLAPDDEAMEETATTHTNDTWELYIINYLISHCDVGGLEQIDEEISSDLGSDFEDSDLGDVEDEPVPVAKSRKEKRGRKQGEKQVASIACLGDEGERSGEEKTPHYIKRVNLSKQDLQIAADLWDNTINPACIEFEKRTGKPAEAMREAIAGVIARRVNRPSNWNSWQKIWWNGLPKVHDKTFRKQLNNRCREEYQYKLKGLATQEALDEWTRTLENDLAQLHDLDAHRAASKVVDIEDELLRLSSLAAREHIHVLFFACSVNPYSLEAQSMSGVGVGSQEMHSVLMDNGQLAPIQLMLNDLKVKLGNQELENRKAGNLPPAFGRARMLKLAGRSRTNRPDPHSIFELFERGDLTGRSDSIPEGTAPSRSRFRKAPRVNDDGDEHRGDSITPNTVARLPPLLVNEALALAVSQVQVPMDGWAPLHVYKLFVVLVEPPPGLDLNEIEGLNDYLTQLKVKIGNLVENGVRMIATHCWCALLALCSNSNEVRKRADWTVILRILKRSQKRLINWCPSISFPIDGVFPKSRQAFRGLVNMFFNPDPGRRLRLVSIDGPITDATPLIINPLVPGGDFYGCTVDRRTIKVDPSTVSQWYPPEGPVRDPDPTPQSAAAAPPTAPLTAHAATDTAYYTTISSAPRGVGLLPMNQGLGDSPNDPLRLDLDFPMDAGNFGTTDTSGLTFLPPSSFITAGAVARPYTSDAQGFPFNPSATLGSSSSHYIPPPSGGVFDPRHARSNFTTATAAGQGFNSGPLSTGPAQVPPPASDQDRRRKGRKVETHDKRVVRVQVGARQVDHRSTATHVPSLDRRQGMSKDEHAELLRARLAEYDATPESFD